jgi:leader peptidase (prepilin peptidase)/N-methyltransferase
MSITALIATAAAVGVSPYLASLALTVPDRANRRWWRPRRPSASRIGLSAACAAGLAWLAATAAQGTAALPAFLALAAFGTVLIIVDAEHHRLPDRMTGPAAIAAAILLAGAAAVDRSWDSLARAGLAAAAMLCLFYVLALVSPRGVGLGDVKLVGLLAGYLGWQGWLTVVAGLAAGFLAAGVVGILLLLTGRATRRTHIPLGPFLIAAALAVAAAGVGEDAAAASMPPARAGAQADMRTAAGPQDEASAGVRNSQPAAARTAADLSRLTVMPHTGLIRIQARA